MKIFTCSHVLHFQEPYNENDFEISEILHLPREYYFHVLKKFVSSVFQWNKDKKPETVLVAL